ncbi:MAG TPA: nuclear transport factor 2 family protein [Acidobacteriota bacterium]|nr:nuclear transport factor 2 family protein [Acidobacteriota bacterium]
MRLSTTGHKKVRAATIILTVITAAIMLSRCRPADGTGNRALLETRLQVLEDREELRLLLKNYGLFLDKRNFAAFAALFSEKEGEWIGGMGKAKGSAAIQKLMEDTIGTGDGKFFMPNYHLFANEMIKVNGDKAEAVSKWLFVVRGEDGGPQPVYLGRYEDSFIRENGAWKFLRRVVSGEIPPDGVEEHP